MTTDIQPTAARESRIRQFRDLWDVPRMFVVEEDGRTLLFDCPFDDETEDYAREYRVYEMSSLTDSDLSESWSDLPRRAIRQLGTIPVKEVAFGSDARLSLSRASIEPFVRQLNLGVAAAPALWVGGGLEVAGIVVAAILAVDAIWLRQMNSSVFGLMLLLAIAGIYVGATFLRWFRANHSDWPLPRAFEFAIRLSEKPSIAGLTFLPLLAVSLANFYPLITPVLQY